MHQMICIPCRVRYYYPLVAAIPSLRRRRKREAPFILPVGMMVMAMTMMVVTEMLHQRRFRYPFAKIELRPRPLEELV